MRGEKVASCQNWACMKEVYIAMTHSFPPQMELRQVQNGGGCPSRFYKNMHQSFFRSLCTSIRKKRWESYGVNWKLLQFMQNSWPNMVLLHLIYISQGNKIYLIVTEKRTYFCYNTYSTENLPVHPNRRHKSRGGVYTQEVLPTQTREVRILRHSH